MPKNRMYLKQSKIKKVKHIQELKGNLREKIVYLTSLFLKS